MTTKEALRQLKDFALIRVKQVSETDDNLRGFNVAMALVIEEIQRIEDLTEQKIETSDPTVTYKVIITKGHLDENDLNNLAKQGFRFVSDRVLTEIGYYPENKLVKTLLVKGAT